MENASSLIFLYNIYKFKDRINLYTLELVLKKIVFLPVYMLWFAPCGRELGFGP